MGKRELPELESIDELARFFEEHSAAAVDLEPEDVRYEPKRQVLSVRFDPEDMVALSRPARRYGMDRSTLVRFVVKRFLSRVPHDEQAAARS